MTERKLVMTEVLGEHKGLREALTLPAGILALEIVFKLSTEGGLASALLPIALFSLAAGLLLELLCSLLPTARKRFAARAVTLFVLGVLFGIEYFVYRQFKLYYDPITVLSGAGDAAGQFSGEALGLVLSPSGIVRVILVLLPSLLCAIAAWRSSNEAAPVGTRSRAAQAGGAVAAHALALVLVLTGPFAPTYTTRYSFQNAVTCFGFLTGLRKDAQVQLAGGGTSFDQETVVPTKEAPSQDESSSTTKKAKKTYQPAALDIDFEALAASTEGTWADLDHYVASLTPSMQNKYTGMFKGYNLIFISAEAFSQEALREDTTPTLWRMWNEGIQLTDYYQFDTAGTTGGECANIFGLLATEGGSSVKGTATYNNYMTLGNFLNRRGYDGWAFHNNTYTYYGRDATHNNLGYNNGYMGYGNGMEQWVTWQWPQSDLEMIQGTFDNLYGDAERFNVYYMSVSGHSNYDPSDNMMAQKNWDSVKDLPYSDRVKGYLACNIELDRAMEYLIGRLEEKGIADRTVIVISADHFPYGLDDDAPVGQLPYLSELYGYEVTNIFQRDHNRPIIWCGSLARRKKPIVVDSPTMSIDLLPTLCNLFGLKWDSRLLPGRDVLDKKTEPLVFNLNYDWRTDLGTYWAGTGVFEAVEGADIPEGYVDAHNAIVANKINYCHGVLTSDYYRHVFGDPDDVATVHDKAKARREKRAAEKAADAS